MSFLVSMMELFQVKNRRPKKQMEYGKRKENPGELMRKSEVVVNFVRNGEGRDTTLLPKFFFGMTLFLKFIQIYNKIYFHTSVFASVED
jgi:hypothetical protein